MLWRELRLISFSDHPAVDLPETQDPQPATALSIDARTWYVDVQFMGAAEYIATGVLNLPGGGLALVDPGPATALEGLEKGLGARGYALEDVRAVLLTHIHLDHAGATGTIAAPRPALDVYVHARGAPHVADPSRLLESARRLYGDQMDALWGEVRPVPEEQVHAIEDGDAVALGRGEGEEARRLRVAYTPGHATHHVSYLDEASGTAFAGDTAGQRTTGVDYVLPVTPPPDVDLPAWQDSLDTLRRMDPERLFCTHFGPHDDPEAHLDQMETRLRAWAEDVRDGFEEGADDEALATAFDEGKIRQIERHVPEARRTPYVHFGRPRESWHGLARYWRTREEA
jgi:glyoxylase-like metal-dependent hydrolase (beta-lactamase superfamily II)